MAQFVLDTDGIREILTSDWMRGEVDAATEEVAARVRAKVGEDVPVEVDRYTTDRDAGAVVIADVAGQLLQARDGVLTRSAAEVGLEVRETG